MGRTAYAGRSAAFALGNVGAGFGAQAGGLKGGLGSASTMVDGKPTVGALIAVNPLGSVTMRPAGFGRSLGRSSMTGGLSSAIPALVAQPADGRGHPMAGSKLASTLGNTSIGVVAVRADLTVAEAKRVAIMAQDGLARAIRPVHTPFDGDCLFVLATGAEKLAEDEAGRPFALAALGALAADCTARAVARGVWAASALNAAASWHDRFGG